MPNFPFVVGDSLQIGTAQITATGNAIVLPSGTQVGSTPVATTQEVATGGGPKITNVQITDNTWAVLDDTAIDITGGYILITGTNFVTGALVYFNQTPANSVAFVSASSLRVTVPALTAGTYLLYVINPDGGTAIRVPGVTASASPAWQTGSNLGEQSDGAISLSLVATDATSYTLVSGSLPPGLSLNTSTGAITGTVTGVSVDTVYTFTVRATDAQLQDSPRTFTVTITVSDPYFRLTTLLLSGSALSANTVIRDSSTNNFNLTVAGDARASNFTPYGTGWSVYFDGTGDYLTIPNSVGLAFGTGDFTVEFWAYVPTSEQSNLLPILDNDYNSAGGIAFCIRKSDNLLSLGPQASGQGLNYCGFTANFALETWNHFVVVAHNSVYKAFLNGTQLSTQFGSTVVQNVSRSSGNIEIGRLMGQTSFDFGGYLSNFRVIKGTALYTANFTPATTTLTAVANTSLLTCHANRFMDGSTNNFTITRNGDARVVSFNPFNITNTGVAGSMYFDGTGDYVQIANSANLAVGAGDFTIECWVNTSTFSLDTYYRRIFTFGSDAANNLQLLFFDGTNAVSTVSVYSNTVLINGTITVANGAWHHVAVCRSGTSLKLFVDGVQSGSTATTSQNFDSAATNGLYIGRFTLAGGHFLGFISDFRVVKGTALYTTTFTPPTSPLTAVANTQLLTLQYDQPHNNHTFLDSSSNQFVITRNGNASQGTFSPFSPGGWSNYFNNASSIVCASNAAFAVGTGNFTVECFVNFSSTTVRNRFFCVGTSGTDGILLELNSGVLSVGIQNTYPINYTWAPIIGTWYHVAIVRTGTGANQVVLYIDGASVATGTSSASVSQNPVNIGGISWNSTWALLGYLSNVRFSNSARTITVPTSPYVSDANTLVLTCQSNRFLDQTGKTITVNSTPSVQAFSPFAPTAVYSPVTHGGSAYFDGSGDYLTLPDNVAFDFPGDFTVEAWVYLNSVTGSQGIYTSIDNSADTWVGVSLIFSGTSFLATLYISNGNTITHQNTVAIGQWYHIAICRSGSTTKSYLNGVQSTGTISSTYSLTQSGGTVGTSYPGSSPLNGYITDLRVIKGTAVYTANFTPPTAPLTAITNTALLLNFTNAAVLDSTGRNVLETAADAKSTSVVTKFTGGSMYFDGTGDSLITPASIVNSIGTGDFTIEFWCYPSNTAVAYRAIVASENYNSTAGGWSIYQNGTGIEIYLTGGALVTAASQLVASTWQHIALVRSGSASNNCKLYVNGTNVASATNTADWTGQKVFIGDNNYTGTDYFFNGYIQDLRITRGYARYTGNFTAPTAPARLK